MSFNHVLFEKKKRNFKAIKQYQNISLKDIIKYELICKINNYKSKKQQNGISK